MRFMGILRWQRQRLEARNNFVNSGWASFYDKDWALSPFRTRILEPPGPRQMGGPEVRPPLTGEPFGFGATPGGDPGVIAGGEHVGDGIALEQLRPGVLRIFQQPLGEAFLGARCFLAHYSGEQP